MWCVFMGCLGLYAGAGAAEVSRKTFWLGFGLFCLSLAVGLVTMRRWARWAALGYFGLGLTANVLRAHTTGLSGAQLLMSLFGAWCVWRLADPSTKRMFKATDLALAARVDLAVLASEAGAVLTLLLLLPAAPRAVPDWVVVCVPLAAFLSYRALLGPAWRQWLQRLLAGRPADVSPEGLFLLKQAWRERRNGQLERAADLLSEAEESRAAILLKGMMSMDASPAGTPLRRIVFDPDFVPDRQDREHAYRECVDTDVSALVAERVRFIDALVVDAQAPSCFFSEEAFSCARRLGPGRGFNEAFRLREWWERHRPYCTGENALRWLTHRLWAAQCLCAAEQTAFQSRDSMLADVASLSLLIDRLFEQDLTLQDINEDAWGLCLVPEVAEILGLLHVDSPLFRSWGYGAVANRLRRRRRLVDWIFAFWGKYDDEHAVEEPWLLRFLTTQQDSFIRDRVAFGKWWRPRRDSMELYDNIFADGLAAMSSKDLHTAEERFRRAAEIRPGVETPACNHALVLMRLKRFEDACERLQNLISVDETQAAWWLYLGDCKRMQGQGPAAVQAYLRAVDLRGVDEHLAAHLGVSMAREGMEAEAQTFLDRAVGADADPDTLEYVSTCLEQHRVFHLAQRYRLKALYRSFDPKVEKREEDEEEGEGD